MLQEQCIKPGGWQRLFILLKSGFYRSQFHLTAHEVKGLRDLCIFFIRVYVKSWTTAAVAIRAPHDDLHLLKSLMSYRAINGLSLFDGNVSHVIKDCMIKAMSEIDGNEKPPKRITVPLDASLQDKSVADFTTKNSKSLLIKFNLPQGILQVPASQWDQNEDYNAARAKAKKLSVTNDHAERSVALVQDFTGRLTKDEDQLQFLLQAVADHRKSYPQAQKRN